MVPELHLNAHCYSRALPQNSPIAHPDITLIDGTPFLNLSLLLLVISQSAIPTEHTQLETLGPLLLLGSLILKALNLNIQDAFLTSLFAKLPRKRSKKGSLRKKRIMVTAPFGSVQQLGKSRLIAVIKEFENRVKRPPSLVTRRPLLPHFVLQLVVQFLLHLVPRVLESRVPPL